MKAEFKGFDAGHVRLVAWLGLSGLVIFLLYGDQVLTLTSGLDSLLTQTLGTVYPSFPFLALLLLLMALRWKDFHRVLLSERGLTTKASVRLVGVGLVVGPIGLWRLAFGGGGADVYFEMEVAAATLVLVGYGTLLLLNPSMARITLPYAALYSLGLISPLLMLDLLGAPLASISAFLTAGIVGASGVPVFWSGPSFEFTTKSGGQVAAVISPVCSAAYSISIFLALLGLMYLDMRRGRGFTLKLALLGMLALPVLNAFRIAIDVWVGFLSGPDAFWATHDWLGYLLFFGFYIAVLLAYSRAPPRRPWRVVIPGRQGNQASG